MSRWSCSKEMRERDFLKPNLSQNPMETRSRMCERECEWVSMRELNTPLVKETGRVHPRRSPAQRSGSRWRRWGPGAVGPGSADLWGRPTPGWPPGAPLWADASSTIMNFGNMVHGQKFARKDVQIIFPKGLKTQKIFLVFFCKKGKVLEKIPACKNNFENFKHAVEKNK